MAGGLAASVCALLISLLGSCSPAAKPELPFFPPSTDPTSREAAKKAWRKAEAAYLRTTQPPDKVADIKVYYLGHFWSQKTRHFIFRASSLAYSLEKRAGGGFIRKDLYYVKTFGGAAPTVSVHVIDDRFVIFPETIKGSEIAGKMLHDRMAKTHVYDLKLDKLVHSSKPYQYNQNIDLRYCVGDILRME